MDILIMLIFILIGIALIIIKSFQKRNLTLYSKIKNPSFSILIPARYESKVIESLLIRFRFSVFFSVFITFFF